LARSFKDKHSDLYTMAGLDMSHLDALLQPYARITHTESVERMRSLGYRFKFGDDYSQEQSDALSAIFDRPYFITDYPQKKRTVRK